jgi:hypothetical protein
MQGSQRRIDETHLAIFLAHSNRSGGMKRVILAASAWAYGQAAPKYAAKVPTSLLTPDTVQTRISTLKFFDGLPDITCQPGDFELAEDLR